MTKITLKNRLRVLRAENNMTQQDLADAINVSRQTIHAIESEKFVPSTVIAIKIANYFHKEMKDVFTIIE